MEIYLDGAKLQLEKDELEVQGANPFLNNDEERLDNVFSLQIPLKDNEKALKYAGNIDSVFENEYKCEVRGSIDFVGVAIITDVSTEDNSATIQIGYAKSAFQYAIKDKYLKDLDFGEIITLKSIENYNEQVSVLTDLSQSQTTKIGIGPIQQTENYIYDESTKYLNIKKKGTYTIIIQGAIHLEQRQITDLASACTITSHLLRGETMKFPYNASYSRGYYNNEVYYYYQATFNAEIGDNIYFQGTMEVSSGRGSFWNEYRKIQGFDNTITESVKLDYKKYCFPKIINTKMGDNLTPDYYQTYYNTNNIINKDCIIDDDRKTTINYPFTSINNKPYINFYAPCLYVNYIVQTIYSLFGYRVENLPFEDLIIFNGAIIGENTENYYKTDEIMFNYPTTYKLNSCFDNESKISEFLASLSVISGQIPIYDNKAKKVRFCSVEELANKRVKIDCKVIKDTINYKKDNNGIRVHIERGSDKWLDEHINEMDNYNYKGEVQSVAELTNLLKTSKLNDYYLVKDEKSFYALIYDQVTESTSTTKTLHWEFKSYQERLNLTQGEESFVEFKSDIPIMMAKKDTVNNIVCPICTQPIKIKNAYGLKDNFSNSFMIVRGVYNGYLLASATPVEEFPTDTRTLEVGGENGLLAKTYKQIAQAYTSGKKHTVEAIMQVQELQKLQYSNYIEVNNCVNILLSYSYTLGEGDIIKISMEMIKI